MTIDLGTGVWNDTAPGRSWARIGIVDYLPLVGNLL